MTTKKLKRRRKEITVHVGGVPYVAEFAPALPKLQKWSPSPEMEAQAERRSEIAKAEIFAPQVFKDGSALVPLSPKERETINTMIDFFRSSDEDEHLDPEVYEAIAEKLGAGRAKPKSWRERWAEAFMVLDLVEKQAGEQRDHCGEPDSLPADIYRNVGLLRDALERVSYALVAEENRREEES